MRFRSSTNAEDLDGFTGAGLYTSKSGDPNDPNSVLDAVRNVDQPIGGDPTGEPILFVKWARPYPGWGQQ
jgi:hypothetical protein